MKRRYRRWTTVLALSLVTAMLVPGPVGASHKPAPVDIQFLTISDWHGQLDSLSVFGEGTFGGAAVLSSYFRQEEAANPNTLIFTAGDAIGATPPLSNFFDDEPAIRAMRLMGVDVDTLGNHNFDRGTAALQNLLNIATDTSGAEAGDPIAYVSANLKNRDANITGVKDFALLTVGGVKVAVIGVTNPEAPELTFPGSFGTIEITKPSTAANKARANAKKAGAQVFVLLSHMGVTGFDDTGAAFGPLIDLANDTGGFDLIVGDHTDIGYVGKIGSALVVENRSRGRTYARISMRVDPSNGRIISEAVDIVDPVSADVTPDPAIVDYLAPLRTQLTALLSVVNGQSTVQIPRTDSCGNTAGRTCESLVGNVVTDAMRTRYAAHFAITNSGGLRAAMTCPTTDNPLDFCPAFTGPNYDITSGQILTVLPFGNLAATVTINGAELKSELENGVSSMPGVNGRYPQVSGLCFSYDVSAPAGSRVTSVVYQAADGTCTGGPVDLTAGSLYKVVMNDFMANGGDGYLNVASRMATQELLDQVVIAYMGTVGTISPSVQGRIVCTTSGATACPTVLP